MQTASGAWEFLQLEQLQFHLSLGEFSNSALVGAETGTVTKPRLSEFALLAQWTVTAIRRKSFSTARREHRNNASRPFRHRKDSF